MNTVYLILYEFLSLILFVSSLHGSNAYGPRFNTETTKKLVNVASVKQKLIVIKNKNMFYKLIYQRVFVIIDKLNLAI